MFAAAFRGCGIFFELAPDEDGLDSTARLASGEAFEQAFDSRHAFPQIANIPANFTQAAVKSAPEPYTGADDADTGAYDGYNDCDCVQIHDGRVAWGESRRFRANLRKTSRFAARPAPIIEPRRRFPARGRSCNRFPAGRVPRGRSRPVRRAVRRGFQR